MLDANNNSLSSLPFEGFPNSSISKNSPTETNMESAARQPRTRKRKAPSSSVGKSDSKAERKREQNRISQQCVRERKAAQSKQIESLLSVLKSGDAASGSDSSRSLMTAHLKLLEENQKLKDALFRMRQKLLSLGNMASVAAGTIPILTWTQRLTLTRR